MQGLATPQPTAAGARGRRPAVFLDKDGTLVDNVPYNVEPARLRFVSGATQSLAALANAGFALVLATNQSGIGLNLFTRSEFAALQAALLQRLRDEAGIELLDVVVCPHAPAADGRPACLCRKPAPGLLTRAALRHGIDLAASWMVGDTLDDVEAGRRAGCRSILLDTGGETVWRRSPLRTPHVRCEAWDEVVHHVLARTLAFDGALAPAGTAH